MNTPSLSYSSGSISERGRLTYSITTMWLLAGFLAGVVVALVPPPARRPRLRFVRQQVSGALTYPIIMMVVGTNIMAFLVIYVVPQVATIFEQQHAELPFATRVLIGFSALITGHWLAFAILLVALVAGVCGALATPRGRSLYSYYDSRNEIATVLEPVMTLAMAAVIVFMMLAVLMPIFQLNQLMQ